MFSNRDLLKIILPSIIQQVLSITISTADSIMVSGAGEAAVSGVSLVGTLDALLIIAFSSLVSGGAVIVSHALGNRDKILARECAKQLIYVATGIALFITIVMSIFCMPLLSLLYGDAEQDVLINADSYMQIIVLSFPFLALYNSCEALFRVMGNTVISMILSFIMNVLNIAGNALFIFVFDMGIAGAAWATVFAQCAALTIVLHHFRDKSKCCLH